MFPALELPTLRSGASATAGGATSRAALAGPGPLVPLLLLRPQCTCCVLSARSLKTCQRAARVVWFLPVWCPSGLTGRLLQLLSPGPAAWMPPAPTALPPAPPGEPRCSPKPFEADPPKCVHQESKDTTRMRDTSGRAPSVRWLRALTALGDRRQVPSTLRRCGLSLPPEEGAVRGGAQHADSPPPRSSLLCGR